MSSIYTKGKKIYISWYDPIVGKNLNKSTGLDNTTKNWKLAKEIAREIDTEIENDKTKYKQLGIKKNTIQNAFDHFVQNNIDKHSRTIAEYNRFFKHFVTHFPADENCSCITKVTAERWLNAIKGLPYQRNTLHIYCKVLKKFLGFLFEYNYIPFFKLNKDVTIKPEVKPIIVFSSADIRAIFDNLSDKNANFCTMIYLLFYTGLRPSDIYNITVDDIDLEKSMMQYYSPKAKEYNIVPLHNDLLPLLTKRINEVKQGNILDYANISNMGKALRRYFSSIGLSGKRYNLRTFRKSFISYAYESGIELASVAKLVGHRQITTTAKYYNKITIGHQQKQINKFSVPTKDTNE